MTSRIHQSTLHEIAKINDGKIREKIATQVIEEELSARDTRHIVKDFLQQSQNQQLLKQNQNNNEPNVYKDQLADFSEISVKANGDDITITGIPKVKGKNYQKELIENITNFIRTHWGKR